MNIHIEGNIGAGKSTLLNYLKDNLKCNISQEPVGEWMKIDLLDKFYKDIDRWSFAFQMNCFISRAHQVEQLPEGNNIIERSIMSDRIFAQNCLDNNNMTQTEFDIYIKWSSWLAETVCKPVKNVIYLRSTPKVSYERIKRRNRDGEQEIPIEYLQQLHDLHDKWLMNNEDINLLVIDADTLVFNQSLTDLVKSSFFDNQ